MKLILAEKPSMAKNIAEALGIKERREGFFKGKDYYVSWLFGHVLTLYDCEDYDPAYRAWNVDHLPILPQSYRYKLIDDPRLKKQYKLVEGLIKAPEIDCIINACDADREGSLIFMEVYNQAGVNKPFKRLWISSDTPEGIISGLAGLKDSAEDRPLIEAGYARQQADWIIGINFTRAVTKLFSMDEVLNIGRVILPTVGLIYKRETEIKNFKPRKYFELAGVFQGDEGAIYEGVFLQDDQTRFDDDKVITPVIKAVKGKSGMIVSVNSKRIVQGPPKLFNITDLQGFISSKYEGFTAEKVLDIVQGLYEKQLVTYPRTASRYLDNSQVEPARRSLEAVKNKFPGLEIVFSVSKHVFDGSKVDSHPALMPTHIVPEGLNPDEDIVYTEIVKRFCAQFMRPSEFDRVEVITEVEGYRFRTVGRILAEPGWKEIYGPAGDEEEPELKLSLRDKMPVKNLELNIISKESKPPARYTIQTLLEAMQNCGRAAADDGELLKGYQIGTPATRAEVLKKIAKIGYVSLKGKSYCITPMGARLVELFPLKDMLEPDFTGRLEKKLKDVERGEFSRDDFLAMVNSIVISGIEQMKGLSGKISRNGSLGKCPVCGSDVLENVKGFQCSGMGCKFFVFKNNALLKRFQISAVPSSLIKLLLANSLRADYQLGNKMVQVSLIEAGERWALQFNFDLATEVVLGKCPDCGRDVVETKKGYACVGFKDSSCKFLLWKDDLYLKKFGVSISPKMAAMFLNSKVFKVKKLTDPRDHSAFAGEIQLVKNPQGLWGFKVTKSLVKLNKE